MAMYMIVMSKLRQAGTALLLRDAISSQLDSGL